MVVGTDMDSGCAASASASGTVPSLPVAAAAPVCPAEPHEHRLAPLPRLPARKPAGILMLTCAASTGTPPPVEASRGLSSAWRCVRGGKAPAALVASALAALWHAGRMARLGLGLGLWGPGCGCSGVPARGKRGIPALSLLDAREYKRSSEGKGIVPPEPRPLGRGLAGERTGEWPQEGDDRAGDTPLALACPLACPVA